MSLTYSTSIGYGFKHDLTDDTMKKFRQHLGLSEEYPSLMDSMWDIVECPALGADPHLTIEWYQSEMMFTDYPATIVIVTKDTYATWERTIWTDHSPTLLEKPAQVPQSLINLAHMLGETKIGWLFYNCVN